MRVQSKSQHDRRTMPRTELDVLLNEPIVITIGTAEEPKRIEIREPSNAELGEYLSLIDGALKRMLRDNMPIIKAAVTGGDYTKLQYNPAWMVDATFPVVAKIVGESQEYVETKMSARQSVAVINAFIDVIGWEFLKERFLSAAKAWSQTATQSNGNAEAPPWPVASSST